MAISIEMIVTLSVPMIGGKTLYFGTFDTGCQTYGAVNGEARVMPSAFPVEAEGLHGRRK
jgi:hypothetical protein